MDNYLAKQELNNALFTN